MTDAARDSPYCILMVWFSEVVGFDLTRSWTNIAMDSGLVISKVIGANPDNTRPFCDLSNSSMGSISKSGRYGEVLRKYQLLWKYWNKVLFSTTLVAHLELVDTEDPIRAGL